MDSPIHHYYAMDVVAAACQTIIQRLPFPNHNGRVAQYQRRLRPEYSMNEQHVPHARVEEQNQYSLALVMVNHQSKEHLPCAAAKLGAYWLICFFESSVSDSRSAPAAENSTSFLLWWKFSRNPSGGG